MVTDYDYHYHYDYHYDYHYHYSNIYATFVTNDSDK